MVSVVLVEDNPADAGLVRKALELHEVEGELIVLNDGEKAIRFIKAMDTQKMDCPALVIIDLNLPKKSGREVLETMRQSKKCGSIPAIVLSSSDARQDRDDAARLGASDYIRKPITLDEFLGLGAVFRKALTRSAASAGEN